MKLVCPPDLVGRLERRTICVRVGSVRDIAGAAAAVRRANTLDGVICDCDVALAAIDMAGGWGEVPVALMVPSVGRFRDVAKHIAVLREANLRVHLPGTAENLVGARMLASLGIAVCIGLEPDPDWEALADLMSYALLGLVPHAPVDPFQTIADNYRMTARSDEWGHVFFDDPSRYLHLDGAGRCALSRRELEAGVFVADDLSKLDSAELEFAVAERADAWRAMFADDHFCTRCEAWRICRARARDSRNAPVGCTAFFCELASVIELGADKRASRRPAEKWRP